MNDTINMLLEAADSLVDESVDEFDELMDESTEETTINGYTLDEAAAILDAADEIMSAMNEAEARSLRKGFNKQSKSERRDIKHSKFADGTMSKEEADKYYNDAFEKTFCYKRRNRQNA